MLLLTLIPVTSYEVNSVDLLSINPCSICVSVSGYKLRKRSYLLICPKYLKLPCSGRKEQKINLRIGLRYLTLRILLGFFTCFTCAFIPYQGFWIS